MTQFSFKGPFAQAAQEATKIYPKGREASAVLALLDLAQRQNEDGHYVTDAAMEAIATQLSMPKIRVLEVAEFFTMINTKPVGTYHLQCCGTTPCMLSGAEDILQHLEQILNIKRGQTTADGLITLSEVECLGACVNAPVIQVNDDYVEDLDLKTATELVEDILAGNKPAPGSRTGRSGSAPAKLQQE